MTVGETTEPLYGRKTKSYLWVHWAETDGVFSISVGRDSECEDNNAVLSVPSPSVRYVMCADFINGVVKIILPGGMVWPFKGPF